MGTILSVERPPDQREGGCMPKYVIDRDMPGAGNLTRADLHGAAQKSCNVIRNMGPETQWVESYVTQDKINCIYIAPDEAAIREHAKLSGFPANSISGVKNIIEPTAAD
jgi:hypothetical protein